MKKEYIDKYMGNLDTIVLFTAFLFYCELYRFGIIVIGVTCVCTCLSMNAAVMQFIENINKPTKITIDGKLYIWITNAQIDFYRNAHEQAEELIDKFSEDGFTITILPYGISFWKTKIENGNVHSVWKRETDFGDRGRRRRPLKPIDRPTISKKCNTTKLRTKIKTLHY